jgi:hypothetical protein
MALTQVVDATRRLVVNVASGTVNAQDMRDNQLALQNDTAFAGTFRSLLDLRRAVDMDVSGEELRALALTSPFDAECGAPGGVTSRNSRRDSTIPGDHHAVLASTGFSSWDEALAGSRQTKVSSQQVFGATVHQALRSVVAG